MGVLLPLSFSSEPVGPTDTVADEGCCCCWLESLASSSLSRALACSSRGVLEERRRGRGVEGEEYAQIYFYTSSHTPQQFTVLFACLFHVHDVVSSTTTTSHALLHALLVQSSLTENIGLQIPFNTFHSQCEAVESNAWCLCASCYSPSLPSQ